MIKVISPEPEWPSHQADPERRRIPSRLGRLAKARGKDPGCSRLTLQRKLHLLASRCEKKNEAWLESIKETPLPYVQFDDLEMMEHSKCKPLSPALAVESEQRTLLGSQVSLMRAK